MFSVAWLTKLINCLEWAMNYPTGDDKTTYRNGETISALRQTGAAAAGTATSDNYEGYFKVIQTAPNKIKIIDGFADDYATETKAGDVLINNVMFKDIAVKEFTITASCFIYLISTAGTSAPNTPTLELFTTKQAYELGKSKTLISRVKFADSKISKFSQEVHGIPIGYIDGDCEE